MAEDNVFDVVIVGAGPSGLATAIECHKAGLRYLVFDKGCVVNSLFHFPAQLVYFTTPELLEIGGLPLVCAQEKPARIEGLKYYRRVAQTYGLRIHQYEKVISAVNQGGDFLVSTQRADGSQASYQGRTVVVATGYYDNPKWLGIPGEDLPKCSHYYTEAHPYFDRDVAVIGAGNSAIEAALELYRGGARVTMIHRGEGVSEAAKYWVKPDIENRIRKGEIGALFESQVVEIKISSLLVRHIPTGETSELKNDFVFALTGYRPDYDFLRRLGIEVTEPGGIPVHDPKTLETNIRGLYVVGALVAGERNNKVFIENGRLHGPQIAGEIVKRLGKAAL